MRLGASVSGMTTDRPRWTVLVREQTSGGAGTGTARRSTEDVLTEDDCSDQGHGPEHSCGESEDGPSPPEL